MKLNVIPLLLIMLFVVGCVGPQPSPSPTATASPTASPVATPEPTLSPTITPITSPEDWVLEYDEGYSLEYLLGLDHVEGSLIIGEEAVKEGKVNVYATTPGIRQVFDQTGVITSLVQPLDVGELKIVMGSDEPFIPAEDGFGYNQTIAGPVSVSLSTDVVDMETSLGDDGATERMRLIDGITSMNLDITPTSGLVENLVFETELAGFSMNINDKEQTASETLRIEKGAFKLAHTITDDKYSEAMSFEQDGLGIGVNMNGGAVDETFTYSDGNGMSIQGTMDNAGYDEDFSFSDSDYSMDIGSYSTGHFSQDIELDKDGNSLDLSISDSDLRKVSLSTMQDGTEYTVNFDGEGSFKVDSCGGPLINSTDGFISDIVIAGDKVNLDCSGLKIATPDFSLDVDKCSETNLISDVTLAIGTSDGNLAGSLGLGSRLLLKNFYLNYDGSGTGPGNSTWKKNFTAERIKLSDALISARQDAEITAGNEKTGVAKKKIKLTLIPLNPNAKQTFVYDYEDDKTIIGKDMDAEISLNKKFDATQTTFVSHGGFEKTNRNVVKGSSLAGAQDMTIGGKNWKKTGKFTYGTGMGFGGSQGITLNLPKIGGSKSVTLARDAATKRAALEELISGRTKIGGYDFDISAFVSYDPKYGRAGGGARVSGDCRFGEWYVEGSVGPDGEWAGSGGIDLLGGRD